MCNVHFTVPDKCLVSKMLLLLNITMHIYEVISDVFRCVAKLQWEDTCSPLVCLFNKGICCGSRSWHMSCSGYLCWKIFHRESNILEIHLERQILALLLGFSFECRVHEFKLFKKLPLLRDWRTMRNYDRAVCTSTITLYIFRLSMIYLNLL